MPREFFYKQYGEEKKTKTHEAQRQPKQINNQDTKLEGN